MRRTDPPEIGWYELTTTEAGRRDAVTAALGRTAPVFPWHRYTFDLPHGAEHLARTSTCEHQAFRYGAAAYGFQFHLDMDAALIERWLELPAYRDELEAAGLGHGAAEIRAATVRPVPPWAPGRESFDGDRIAARDPTAC